MRLGEILRHDGLVTAEHVDRALRAQAGLGGRIGTNLIELGAIHPDQVANALARQKGVPATRKKHFDDVAATTLRMLPRHLAERHNAIPVGISNKFGRELVVAFLDPDDIAAVDEVSFAAGMRVRPAVAPEFYVIQYLERFYNVPPRRFLRTDAPIQALDMDRSGGRNVPRETSDSWQQKTGPITNEIAEEARAAAKAAATPPPETRRSRPSTIDLGWDMPDEADVPLPPDPRPAPRPAPAPAAPAPAAPALAPAVPMLTADEALAAIADATSRDEIGDALVGYLVASFGTGAVLICKQDAALGWRGHFPGIDADTVESITIALGVASAFHTAHRQRAAFRGAPPPDGADIQQRLWKHLHCAAPAEILVAPVALGPRVINLVYAHAADGGPLPEGSGDRLDELCSAAADGFVRLIKAKKGQ